MSDEEWVSLPKYEGWYEISSIGRVRRIKPGSNTSNGKILRLQTHKDGYIFVDLCKNGISIKVSVSRSVCEAFNGLPPLNYECNHKDRNKSNNIPSNLEWVTAKDNIKHAFKILGKLNKGHPMPKGKDHPLSKKYIVTDPDGKEYEIIGLSTFCKEKGLSSGAMFQLVTGSGHSTHHKGWKCRYKVSNDNRLDEITR